MRKLARLLKGQINLLWCLYFLALVFYNEYFVYFMSSKSWIRLNCDSRKECTKILLVADPQLVGYQRENFLLWPLTTWDCDRYLTKGFRQAFDFVEPDIVIFLGDLYDEGTIATDSEFRRFGRRFFKIFMSKWTANVKHIFLPGDNDIGGEGSEIITSHNVMRFNRMFEQPDVIPYKNMTFYKINRLLQLVPKMPQKMEFFDSSKLVIALSHVPMLFVPSPFVEKVLSRMQPHLLLTAHTHKSMIISTDALLRDTRHISPLTEDTKLEQTVTLGISDIYEIIVPTCSYRMGTHKIGYGYAILENNELRYTVLWTPKRLKDLHTYLLGIAIFALYLFFKLFKRCSRRSDVYI